MRKALLGLLPVMLMMLAFPALAEPYTFSNGAQWGMSKAEIAEIEKAEPDDDVSGREHVQGVMYCDQTVSKYTADRVYVLADDELFSVWYGNFSSNEDKDLKYLQGALTSLYGEAVALPTENVAKFVTDVADSDLGGEVTFSSQWTVGDDTNICLFNVTSDFDEKYIILIYIDANFDESQIGIYDTTVKRGKRMKHCIIAKFNESVVDKPAAIESVKALFASAAPIEGVNGIVIHENCVERDNRYDLMIVVEMEKAALPNWDASEIHHRWKNQFGGMLEKKAIFDYED